MATEGAMPVSWRSIAASSSFCWVVVAAPGEHVAYLWLPLEDAIEKVASWTHREALQPLKDPRAA